MLSIQAVTVVTNHDEFNKGHAWMDTKQKVVNHKTDKLPQNAPAQSEAQEARQLSQGAHNQRSYPRVQ